MASLAGCIPSSCRQLGRLLVFGCNGGLPACNCSVLFVALIVHIQDAPAPLLVQDPALASKHAPDLAPPAPPAPLLVYAQDVVWSPERRSAMTNRSLNNQTISSPVHSGFLGARILSHALHLPFSE